MTTVSHALVPSGPTVAGIRFDGDGADLGPVLSGYGTRNSIPTFVIVHGEPADKEETVVPVVDERQVGLGDQRCVSHIDKVLAAQLLHAFDHLRDEVAIDSLIRLIAVDELGIDGDAVIHTQKAVHDLFEIRPMGLAEPVGNDKGLVVVFPVIEEILPYSEWLVVS